MSDVDCPRARTWMTPCIARDGATALDDPQPYDPEQEQLCVGCGANPRALLLDLSERYEPVRRHRQTHNPAACADLLTRFVAEYVNRPEPSP